MDTQTSVNTPESVAIPSHHHPLSTPKREHENRRRCVSIYLPVSPRVGSGFRALFLLLVAFLSCSSLAAPAIATGIHEDRPTLLVEDHLPWTGSALLLDLSPPPQVPQLMPPLKHADDATNIRTPPPSKRAINTDSKANDGDFSVPTPFDSALSNNFTNSCAKFINSMRQNADFQNCRPFSLLLQVLLQSIVLCPEKSLTASRHRVVSSMPPNPPFVSPRPSTRPAQSTRHSANQSWTVSPRNFCHLQHAKPTTTVTIPWSYRPTTA